VKGLVSNAEANREFSHRRATSVNLQWNWHAPELISPHKVGMVSDRPESMYFLGAK
jgi:hypothetical protein